MSDDPNEAYDVVPIKPGPHGPPKGWWTVKRNGLSTVLKHHFARQAAAALLKFAKATSDPQVAAALVEKAADLKDRLDGLPPPLSDVLDSHETPTPNNNPQ